MINSMLIYFNKAYVLRRTEALCVLNICMNKPNNSKIGGFQFYWDGRLPDKRIIAMLLYNQNYCWGQVLLGVNLWGGSPFLLHFFVESVSSITGTRKEQPHWLSPLNTAVLEWELPLGLVPQGCSKGRWHHYQEGLMGKSLGHQKCLSLKTVKDCEILGLCPSHCSSLRCNWFVIIQFSPMVFWHLLPSPETKSVRFPNTRLWSTQTVN